MPKLMPLSLHLHLLLHPSTTLLLLLHLYLVNLLLGMNSATPNTVIPTGRLPNTKSETVSVKKPEVTNTLTPTVNSKPSLMSLTSSDSEPKIPDSQFITLNSQWPPFMNTSSPWLPFTNIPSLLLPFLMELHPSLPKKLLRSLQLKLSI